MGIGEVRITAFGKAPEIHASNQPIPTVPTDRNATESQMGFGQRGPPHPQMPHLHGSSTPPGLVTPPLSWAACAST